MSEKKYCSDCKNNKIVPEREGTLFICGRYYRTLLHPGFHAMDSLIARLDPDACGPGARYWEARDE